MKNVRARRRNNQTCATNNSRGRKDSSKLLSNAADDPLGLSKTSNLDLKRLSCIFLNFVQEVNGGHQIIQKIDKAPVVPKEMAVASQSAEEKKTEMSEETIPIKSYKQNNSQVTTSEIDRPVEPTQEPTIQRTLFEETANFLHAFGGQNPDLDKLVEYLNFCYTNKLLKPESIQALGELIMLQRAQVAHNEELLENTLARADSGDRDYPNNCMHVRICYFIWDKQNKTVIDPTELGRKYKELYFAVLLIEKKWHGSSLRAATRQVYTRKPARNST